MKTEEKTANAIHSGKSLDSRGLGDDSESSAILVFTPNLRIKIGEREKSVTISKMDTKSEQNPHCFSNMRSASSLESGLFFKSNPQSKLSVFPNKKQHSLELSNIHAMAQN